jgi:hypothetical protein
MVLGYPSTRLSLLATLNQLANFHDNWYEYHATKGRHSLVPIVTIPLTREEFIGQLNDCEPLKKESSPYFRLIIST